jgi:predicted ribosome quality control (RQC) complex YloA/Tae2 family protein
MGCSVRFADNPGRTKERRIERFAGQHAPRPGKAKETRRVEAEGEAEMSENEKSTDPELSAAERKELRGREAKEAVADHEAAQQAFHENRERLREERLAREAAAGPMFYPVPELPDDTPHRKRPIFDEDPERGNSRGMENRRRNSRGF